MSKDKTQVRAIPHFHRPTHEVPDFNEFFSDDVSGLPCVCNDVLTTPEGALRYQKALERATLTTDELLDEPFSAMRFYIFQVESRNEEGITTGSHYRIVFMDAFGNTYETHSDTAMRTLRAWIAVNGWDVWSPALAFTIEQKKGASGRTYHQLRTVPADISDSKPA